MGAVVALAELLDARTVWRGEAVAAAASPPQPTGHPALDAALPGGGWPDQSLSEILLRADGMGELSLLFPTLARLTRAGGRAVLIAPPYLPHAPAWARAGIDLKRMQVVHAQPRDAPWAAEQCLRSAACAAVLCWPRQANDKTLRRLQVAAGSGQCLGFAFRDAREAANPSPAALRLLVESEERIRILKCRGGVAPERPLSIQLQ